MSGIKKDNGKVRPSLVLSDMPRALLAVAEVATFGAEKYSDGNWLHVDGALSRYTDAKDRHRLQGGIEARDSESGLLHAAHEAWNALAVLELMIRGSERATEGWPESAELHIDVIGQNGEHYEQAKDVTEPLENKKPLTRAELMRQTWFMNSATLEDRDAFIANGVPIEPLDDWAVDESPVTCGYSSEYHEVCSWFHKSNEVGDSEIHRIGNNFYWGAPE